MDPLLTDEKLESPGAKEKDMDSQMLFGCSGFVVSSFATYLLAVWPFFVWMDIHYWPPLWKAVGFGLPAAFIQGAVATWKFEIAGAAGFVGGTVAACIFLYLRFQQVFLEAGARRIPFPPYPVWVEWFAPLAVLLSALLLSTAILVLQQTRHKTAKKT